MKNGHDEIETFQAEIVEDIRYLAESIGPRFAGSEGDSRASTYIAKRFAENGYKAEKTCFQIMGWDILQNAKLQVTANKKTVDFDCFPQVYSSSTPEKGVKGLVRYWGKQEPSQSEKYRPFEREKLRDNKYSVVDGQGTVVGQILSRDFPDGAAAAPWGALPLPHTVPTVVIGEKDGRMLESMLSSHEEVEACLQLTTSYNPSAVTSNIVAVLPGSDPRRSSEEILVAAHYDTQYGSPGATDDASGVACVLALSKYFQRRKLKRSLRFAMYGAEEIGLVGSNHHYLSLRASKKLEAIRAMLNLDMLSCNEPNWIHASEDFLAQESVRRAVKNVGIQEKYGSVEIVTPPWPSGDQDAFYDAKIPCVSLTWKGYQYPFIHLPSDTMDKVRTDILFDSFSLSCSLVEAFDEML
jgi:aminopeptidase YwaD